MLSLALLMRATPETTVNLTLLKLLSKSCDLCVVGMASFLSKLFSEMA